MHAAITGQAFDEINLKRWSMSGNTKCPVSGQELRMHKDKVQYTKHHLLRNIIRQQAAKAKVRSVACFAIRINACSVIVFCSRSALWKDNANPCGHT